MNETCTMGATHCAMTSLIGPFKAYILGCVVSTKADPTSLYFIWSLLISFTCLLLMMAYSALDSGSKGPGSSPSRVIVLCSWARHFTLTVPLSTHELV